MITRSHEKDARVVKANIPTVLSDGLQVFALCGFAVAQPILDLVGNNPTFFVAHGLDGLEIVLLSIALVFVPPVAVLGLIAVVHWIDAGVARVVRALLLGLLVAITVAPPIERVLGLSTVAWCALVVLVAVAASLTFLRFSAFRTFFTFLGPAPLLFLAVFAFVSPTHTLIFGSDPAAAAIALEGTRTPVVMLVVDELPLGVLLDSEGRIDAARYPGFARLARSSTWYPKATTVALATQLAVPAAISGHFPPANAVPVAADYPQSLFTLLGRSHRLEVDETVTRLCPREICAEGGDTPDTETLLTDLSTVYFRAVLPSGTADALGVPQTGDRWAGFGNQTDPSTYTREATLTVDEDIAALSADQPARFEAFLTTLQAGDPPGLWFEHNLLPHSPYEYLPDGRRYNGQGGFGHFVANWPNQEALVRTGAQRLVMQTMFLDRLVNRFLDRLASEGILDDALVVVVADHGIAFEPGTYRRTIETPESRDAVLPVPLFIKYPGQTRGAVDERDARTIDVVPTIADALSIDLPEQWSFDGRSLAGREGSQRPIVVFGDPGSEGPVRVSRDIDARRTADYLRAFLSDGGAAQDPYRIGPFGDFVGEPVESLGLGTPIGSVRADDLSAYEDVDLDGLIPALFEASLTGVPENQWIAVTLNGTIAGIGQAYTVNGETRTAAMLDPSLMRAGSNAIEAYGIGQDGTLHLLNAR